jgi:hypothetical protein
LQRAADVLNAGNKVAIWPALALTQLMPDRRC